MAKKNDKGVTVNLPAGFKGKEAVFESVEGFLVRPTEENPIAVQVSGIILEKVNFIDPKRKDQPRFFLVLESPADQPEAKILFEAEDGESPAEERPVTKGMKFGVSGSGALKIVAGKIGHMAHLVYTGKKKETPNGDMWEVRTFISDEPVRQIGVSA